MACTGRWRLWALAAAACTVWIWSNSLWPAEQSAAQSGQTLELLGPLLGLLPVPADLWPTLIRKLAHMAEYALLGALWAAALYRKEQRPALRRASMALAACLVTALLDETIQAFVPGRGSRVADVWIDLLGALCGLLFGALVRAGVRRVRAYAGRNRGADGSGY